MRVQFVPLTQEAKNKRHARTTNSYCKGSLDPTHIGEQNTGKLVTTKDCFKLCGASGEKKSGIDGRGARSCRDDEAVSEGSLCGGDTKCTPEELKDWGLIVSFNDGRFEKRGKVYKE